MLNLIGHIYVQQVLEGLQCCEPIKHLYTNISEVRAARKAIHGF